MKVYQVMDGWDYYVTVGIFSTKKLAEKAMKESKSDALYISEMIIDSALKEYV